MFRIFSYSKIKKLFLIMILFFFFRLQRHFAVFAISFPGLDALKTIYLSILNGHISAASLPQAVHKSAEKLVDAALAMNQKVTNSRTFFPLNVLTNSKYSVWSLELEAVMRFRRRIKPYCVC